MDLTHRFTVPATLDEAWTAFSDIARTAPCFPGATIASIGGDDFAGSVKVKLGPIALVYAGTGTYLERDRDGARMVMELQGRDKRGNGTATATMTTSFTAQGEQTDVEVQTDLSITGKPAQFGRGVISDVSDKLVDQFVSCVSGRFSEGLGAPAPESPESPKTPKTPEHSDAELTRPSVELGESPGDVEGELAGDVTGGVQGDPTSAESGRGGSLDGVDAPPDVDTAPGAASTRPETTDSSPRGYVTPPATPAPRKVAYTPPAKESEPDFQVVATVLPVLLKRYWPVLGGAAVAAFVVRLVLRRAKH